jgi:hypothetical protein
MSRTAIAQAASSYVEETTLPKIIVKARGGAPQIEAYVNAYIVGNKPTFMKDHSATPLYYLSMVAMKGQGTTLQGVFARLVSTHTRDVSIEGIGEVALAHHQFWLADCGYTLHWNFEQAEVLPAHDLHAVIESNMLTVCDPIRGMTVKQRESRTARTRQGKRPKERTSLSTAKNSKTQQSLAEIRNREKIPLFLLIVPGWHKDDASFLHQLHLSFLDPRLPWPLDPSWASFLWERGIERREIEPLKVWSYSSPAQKGEDAEDDEAEEPVVPFLGAAYFCHPRPVQIQQDIREALLSGRIGSRLHTHLLVLPTASPQREEEEERVAVAGM